MSSLDGHDGLDVTNERIRAAHSLMSVEWLNGDEEVHSSYKQGHDERCYICALLAKNERYRIALQNVQGIAINGSLYEAEGGRLDQIDACVTEALRV